MVSVIRLTGWN